MLTPAKSFLLLGFFYFCANFGENRSRNTTVRVCTVHRRTDTHTRAREQTQTGFIICPMLYAIGLAMGQIIRVAYSKFSRGLA